MTGVLNEFVKSSILFIGLAVGIVVFRLRSSRGQYEDRRSHPGMSAFRLDRCEFISIIIPEVGTGGKAKVRQMERGVPPGR